MLKTDANGKNEEGFASIVVALTMIIVLALLAVGFAQLARREQQGALDKQLSSQAYYAAESGINDVDKYIKDGSINDSTKVQHLNTNQCLTGPLITNSSKINPDTGVEYTCVLANLEPPSLEYKDVLPDTSKVVNFQAAGLSSLSVEWTSTGAVNFPSDKKFLPSATWNDDSHKYPSVIQFALTPYNTGSASRDTLIDSTDTKYLYPTTSSGSTPYSNATATQGAITNGGCNTSTNKCKVTITGIPQTSDYLLHFVNIYATSNITIKGLTTTGAEVHFKGAQAVIDVTGKARNVLKRLRVTKPLNAKPDLPGYTIEGQNICKRIQTEPTGTSFNAPSDSGSSSSSCVLDQ